MLSLLLRLLAEMSPAATWIAVFVMAVVTVFVIYVGVAIWATLRPGDPEQTKIRYQVFRDLLDLFRVRRPK